MRRRGGSVRLSLAQGVARAGRWLDPRRRIAAAIGWTVFGLVTCAALVTAGIAAGQAERRARADAEGQLAEFATQVRDAIALTLETRRSLLLATAAQIDAAPREAAIHQRLLQAVQVQFPEFAWLGLSDTAGRLRVDSGEPALALPLDRAPWIGSAGSRFADTRALQAGGEPRRIEAVVPLRGGGQLGAALSWTWVEQQVLRMQGALNRNRQVELLLVSRDGRLLLAPAGGAGRPAAAAIGSVYDPAQADEQGAYVIGSRARLRLADGQGLGWTAIVRQPAALALAPVHTTRRTVFLLVAGAGLLSALAAALAAQWLTRRLSRLAHAAEAVRRGEQRSLARPGGADEVGRIGATLAQLVDQLQAEKQSLQALNVELDQRVAERTARIERMAGEARQAAVTRERLRLARELHDTLAHSLMALLTQIRLVRKLRARMDPDELDAELARAEQAAGTGLAEARAAIGQMRDNAVRDNGLGPALHDLVQRLRQRSGLVVHWQADGPALQATGERAETVFRIAEEALRNVERHAAAQCVRVALQPVPGEGGGRARFEVADDGVGFDPAQARPGHWGLRGIQEQAALIDAALSIGSAPAAGTRVVLEFEV